MHAESDIVLPILSVCLSVFPMVYIIYYLLFIYLLTKHYIKCIAMYKKSRTTRRITGTNISYQLYNQIFLLWPKGSRRKGLPLNTPLSWTVRILCHVTRCSSSKAIGPVGIKPVLCTSTVHCVNIVNTIICFFKYIFSSAFVYLLAGLRKN